MIINFNNLDLSQIKNPKVKAILICLFTDRRATEEELPDYTPENRGWWGDSVEVSVAGKKELISWGSLLWTLRRAKLTDKILTTVKEYIKQALNPLLKAGYINEPEVIVSRDGDCLNFVLQFADEVLEIKGVKL